MIKPSSTPRRSRTLRLIGVTVLVSLGLAAGAIAAGSPAAGPYRSAGKVRFRFRLTASER